MMMKQRGFTIIETLAALVLMSIAALAVSGLANQVSGMYRAERDLDNRAELRAIADAHLKYAALHNNGALLGSYTAGSCTDCPIDTTVQELTTYVETRAQRLADAMNYDNSSNRLVRGLMLDENTYQSTFSTATASNMVLEYRAGVIVQTSCPPGGTCDTGASWANPIYVQSGWAANPVITDWVPYSNLEIMQDRAVATIDKLLFLQRKIRDYTQELVISNPSIVDANYLPLPNLPASPDLSGTDPTMQGGCINGWHDLSSADVNVLEIVGVTKTYGTTIFGAPVEYCADFDLSAVDASSADTAPHVGALRINRFVTTGAAPAASNTDNIIFPI